MPVFLFPKEIKKLDKQKSKTKDAKIYLHTLFLCIDIVLYVFHDGFIFNGNDYRSNASKLFLKNLLLALKQRKH